MIKKYWWVLLILFLAGRQYYKKHPPMPTVRAAQVPQVALSEPDHDWPKRFPERFPLQVAVYWTDPSVRGLGVIHVLQQMGIPFFVTRDLKAALRHHQVILYPEVVGTTFSAPQIASIDRFVKEGGCLWGQHITAGGLREVFGYDSSDPRQNRYKIEFQGDGTGLFHYLDRPEEKTVRLGDPNLPKIIWSDGYKVGKGGVALAKFEDGSAAILHKEYGKGEAFLCAVGLDDVVARSEANRDFEAQREYVNRFEPGADVWRLILRSWYETRATDWIRLTSAPDGKNSVVCMSHDVDWEYSIRYGLAFANLEKEHHFPATYFIQTKYLDDGNSRGFFFGPSLPETREIAASGGDIESHSVIHAHSYNSFPLGSGNETFADYRGKSVDFDHAVNATVFGEIRVSKSLLEGEVPDHKVTFFRAGHLRVPPALPQALEQSGYEFDSSFTADDLLGGYPFPMTRDLDFATETKIYEFPVTIEDEESPLLTRIPQTLDIIRANADNGAPNVVLIHTNDPKDKVEAEKQILEGIPKDIMMSDMITFARFWRSRDRVVWTLKSTKNSALLSLKTPDAVHGLTFEFQRPVQTVSAGHLANEGRRLVLPDLAKGSTISIQIGY